MSEHGSQIDASPGPGRPSGYRAKYAQQAKVLARLGATDREIAEALGIDPATVLRWRVAHKAFANAIRVGKAAADARVEQSLYRRATGYSFDALKIQMDKDGYFREHPYVEHVPPDTTACIFWLKNRKPQDWRDRQEHTHEFMTTPADLRAARERAITQA